MRALVKALGDAGPCTGGLGDAADATVERALRGYAEALAADPWTARWPLVLRGVRLARDRGQWALVDDEDAGLPLRPAFQAGLPMWRLLSASGGRPVTVLAEWDGETALPLGGLDGPRYFDLAPRSAA
jgi:hypothetical protein